MGNDGMTISLMKPVRTCRLVHSKLHRSTPFAPFMMTNGNCASEKE